MHLLLALILAVAMTPLISTADTLIEKGRYIFQLANCYACHTDVENEGPALAGGRVMQTEFGTFYTPNITADKETGIGLWSDQQFTAAVRSGLAPDGSHYYPVFPYNSYKDITDPDIEALKAYIFSLPPVKQQNKAHDLSWFVNRLSMPLWKTLNQSLQVEQTHKQTRGAYVVDTLGHCNECHTPRNNLGILQMEQKLTGNDQLSAPDISPESLKSWNKEELVDLFSDGALPDGDYVSDHMAEVVEFSTSHWKPEDLKAVIRYLRKN